MPADHPSLAGFTPLGLAIPMRDCPEGCLVALVGAMEPAALTAVADVTAKTLDPEAPRRERDDSNTRETPEAPSNNDEGPGLLQFLRRTRK